MKKINEQQMKLDALLNSFKDRKICVLDGVSPCSHCGDCLMCDLDPNKICDNCGKCLDTINTDEKGYASIMIDKVEAPTQTLADFYKMAGVDDIEEDDDLSSCECEDEDCDCHDHNHNHKHNERNN